jgi:hypothetical protein
MKRFLAASLGLLILCPVAPARAQVGVNAAGLFETYTFGSGLGYSEVSQFTFPITFTTRVGGRAALTLSSGFTRVELVGEPGQGQEGKTLSGLVDSEARLVLDLVPERVSAVLTAVAPTGMEALEVGEGAVLTALSSQVMGFSTASLGGGGRAGGGLAAALPLGGGDMALGFAGTYTHSLAYNPMVGRDAEWKPGAEIRLRAGLEGSPAPGTYLRVAGIFANRAADLINGEEFGRTGSQLHGYVAVTRTIGSGNLGVYLMNSYRSAPQVEATGVGAVLLPKGNLLSLGARAEIPLVGQATLVPQVELRRLSEASREGAGDGALAAAGSTVRAGANLKVPVGEGVALVLEGNGLFGNVGKGDGGTADVSGFRGGVHLQIRR